MPRLIKANDSNPLHRRVYFDVRLTDGILPAPDEEGGQPEVSINGTSWTPTLIDTLTEIGHGRYYADLSPSAITTEGDIIETRYKGSLTAEIPGDSFQVVSSVAILDIEEESVFQASSYVSLNEADDYFESRINSEAWEDSADSDKLKALKSATKMIDHLAFEGSKTISDQELEFPRDDSITIPNDIKIACMEIAVGLLEGLDPDQEIANIYANSRSFAATRTGYDRSFVPEHLRAGIVSPTAWMYLKPYLVVPNRTIKLNRV